MAEQNTVETVETEAVTEETRAAIEEAWNDDSGDFDDWSKGPEATDEPAEEQGEQADSGDDEGGSESAEAEAAAEPEPEDKGEAGHQRFKLKVRGEEKEVDLDEMTALAQKGGDYDGLREDRDNLRTENGKLKEYETFLKELAENGGLSVDELMESTRAELLVRSAKKEGKTLSPEEAREQVRAAHKKQQEPAEQAPKEKTPEEKAQEAVQAFVQKYPNVKSSDIPQSVWDEANRTGDLIGAYQEHRLQQMSEEIAQLKQNNKNKERSTGSRKTAGAASARSKVDEVWDSCLQDDW